MSPFLRRAITRAEAAKRGRLGCRVEDTYCLAPSSAKLTVPPESRICNANVCRPLRFLTVHDSRGRNTCRYAT